MPSNSFEIRKCDSCGLRYPLVDGHPHGTRCPVCMGETRVILNRQLNHEPELDRPATPLSPPSTAERGKRSVLLDNIRSAWNVGSIFRSADGFGFDHAFLCGITPTPDNEAVLKTSLGAEETVTWSYHKDAVKLVTGLKRDGWKMCALEDDARAISIESASITVSRCSTSAHREILILGSEVTGVDPDLLDLCDIIYYIPMRGEKKSFNVAIAFSIAAYAMR